MKICLIGKNITNFVLANNLANKNLDVDIIFDCKKEKKNFTKNISNIKRKFQFFN